MSSDDDDVLKTIEMSSMHLDPTDEVLALLNELDELMKNGEVATALTEKGINASVALLASQALAAYLRGSKQEAAADFQAVSEEIRDRLELGASGKTKAN